MLRWQSFITRFHFAFCFLYSSFLARILKEKENLTSLTTSSFVIGILNTSVFRFVARLIVTGFPLVSILIANFNFCLCKSCEKKWTRKLLFDREKSIRRALSSTAGSTASIIKTTSTFLANRVSSSSRSFLSQNNIKESDKTRVCD